MHQFKSFVCLKTQQNIKKKNRSNIVVVALICCVWYDHDKCNCYHVWFWNVGFIILLFILKLTISMVFLQNKCICIRMKMLINVPPEPCNLDFFQTPKKNWLFLPTISTLQMVVGKTIYYIIKLFSLSIKDFSYIQLINWW